MRMKEGRTFVANYVILERGVHLLVVYTGCTVSFVSFAADRRPNTHVHQILLNRMPRLRSLNFALSHIAVVFALNVSRYHGRCRVPDHAPRVPAYCPASISPCHVVCNVLPTDCRIRRRVLRIQCLLRCVHWQMKASLARLTGLHTGIAFFFVALNRSSTWLPRLRRQPVRPPGRQQRGRSLVLADASLAAAQQWKSEGRQVAMWLASRQ